jgi:type IV pilus assembly protein PilZ
MTEIRVINYVIKEPLELNLAYMPFITNGGLFIASFDSFALGEQVIIDLLLPGKKETIKIEGKVVWITPNNALHHVLPGLGLQFIGNNALTTRALIESNLDKLMEVGGYTYGITEAAKKTK